MPEPPPESSSSRGAKRETRELNSVLHHQPYFPEKCTFVFVRYQSGVWHKSDCRELGHEPRPASDQVQVNQERVPHNFDWCGYKFSLNVPLLVPRKAEVWGSAAFLGCKRLSH